MNQEIIKPAMSNEELTDAIFQTSLMLKEHQPHTPAYQTLHTHLQTLLSHQKDRCHHGTIVSLEKHP